MAEERLIDDDLDKDKKYRIRRNADGEEELIIDDSVVEQEDLAFEFGSELTEERTEPYAEGEQDGSATDSAPREVVGAYLLSIEKAEREFENKDYEAALSDIASAQSADPYDGASWALKIKVLTENFTRFEVSDELLDAAENVSKYCGEELKAELSDLSAPLESKIISVEESAAELHVQVEKKKAERRELFIADRKKALVFFTVTLVPFLVCLVVALAFTSVMFARQDGANLIIMIVFAALAVLLLIATLFTGRNLWAAMKKVALNEKNSSTQMGRDYEDRLDEAEKLRKILDSFKK